MALDLATVNRVLAGISCPGGGDLVSRDLVRALSVEGDAVRFVLEAASADEARALGPVQAAAEAALRAAGASSVQIVMTAHGPAGRPAPKAPAPGPEGQPPSLKIGQHPTRIRAGRSRLRGLPISSSWGQARAGWANPPYRRTLPWRWRAMAAGWGCWMPTSMARASRA